MRRDEESGGDTSPQLSKRRREEQSIVILDSTEDEDSAANDDDDDDDDLSPLDLNQIADSIEDAAITGVIRLPVVNLSTSQCGNEESHVICSEPKPSAGP